MIRLFSRELELDIIRVFQMLAISINENARDKGFWDSDRNDGEMIALMHSELSEALEGIRHKNPPSEHIPEFSAAEEEFADCVIRILDTCYARNWNLPGAILAKMKFNSTRPHMHDKTC